jgi:hypothetical protein
MKGNVSREEGRQRGGWRGGRGLHTGLAVGAPATVRVAGGGAGEGEHGSHVVGSHHAAHHLLVDRDKSEEHLTKGEAPVGENQKWARAK